MNYDLRKPCNACPFRKVGGVKLRPGRIKEIGEPLTEPNGHSFTCHKTLDTPDEKHCAGALIFAEKHNAPTQMMRIVERLGMYDRNALLDHDDVWDSLDEWIEGGAL